LEALQREATARETASAADRMVLERRQSGFEKARSAIETDLLDVQCGLSGRAILRIGLNPNCRN
jgi:hypothetical protein